MLKLNGINDIRAAIKDVVDDVHRKNTYRGITDTETLRASMSIQCMSAMLLADIAENISIMAENQD